MPPICFGSFILKFQRDSSIRLVGHKKVNKNFISFRTESQILLYRHRQPHGQQPHLLVTLRQILKYLILDEPLKFHRCEVLEPSLHADQKSVHASSGKNPQLAENNIEVAGTVLQQFAALPGGQDPEIEPERHPLLLHEVPALPGQHLHVGVEHIRLLHPDLHHPQDHRHDQRPPHPPVRLPPRQQGTGIGSRLHDPQIDSRFVPDQQSLRQKVLPDLQIWFHCQVLQRVQQRQCAESHPTPGGVGMSGLGPTRKHIPHNLEDPQTLHQFGSVDISLISTRHPQKSGQNMPLEKC